MPAGGTVIGFAAFGAVKAAGYIGAAYVLKKKYAASGREPWKSIGVGFTRLLIGLVVGAVYGAAMSAALFHQAAGKVLLPLYFILLFPVRMGEWTLLIKLFFDRQLRDKSKLLLYTTLGSVWSYALDAIGIAAAFVVPGGVWIC